MPSAYRPPTTTCVLMVSVLFCVSDYQVSLPKGKGVKLTILEERAAKVKKAQNN